MDGDNIEKNPAELIRKAKKGDTDAFGQLYESYFAPIFRYIYLKVVDKEVAKDLTQTVFLKVFCSLNRYEEKNKNPLSYFFTVAKNTIIDYWKKKKEKRLNELNLSLNFNNNFLEIENKIDNEKMIFRAIKQLTEEQQEVIILKFIVGLTNKEIAHLLEKKEENIRQIQCRALKNLSNFLKN